jgi:hypothetical protein
MKRLFLTFLISHTFIIIGISQESPESEQLVKDYYSFLKQKDKGSLSKIIVNKNEVDILIDNYSRGVLTVMEPRIMKSKILSNDLSSVYCSDNTKEWVYGVVRQGNKLKITNWAHYSADTTSVSILIESDQGSVPYKYSIKNKYCKLGFNLTSMTSADTKTKYTSFLMGINKLNSMEVTRETATGTLFIMVKSNGIVLVNDKLEEGELSKIIRI